MVLPKMRFSLTSSADEAVAPVSTLARLAIEIGQSENIEQLAASLKSGLEEAGFQGCFLMSCFGFNRETRFGRWKSRYVFPLRSDLTEVKPTLSIRDDLIVVGSGYFTLVVGRAAKMMEKNRAVQSDLLMLSESTRLWVKSYTAQVEQQFDSLNHRKASCQQLLDVVHQLDQSSRDLTSGHNRMLTSINAGAPASISQLGLRASDMEVILDEIDDIGRAYTIFTKQQMELNRQLKEQVRSIAGFLLPREQH